MWGDIGGSGGVQDSTVQSRWGTGEPLSNVNEINRLGAPEGLRTKGSWVRILPGAPFIQGVAAMQPLFFLRLRREPAIGSTISTTFWRSVAGHGGLRVGIVGSFGLNGGAHKRPPTS